MILIIPEKNKFVLIVLYHCAKNSPLNLFYLRLDDSINTKFSSLLHYMILSKTQVNLGPVTTGGIL